MTWVYLAFLNLYLGTSNSLHLKNIVIFFCMRRLSCHLLKYVHATLPSAPSNGHALGHEINTINNTGWVELLTVNVWGQGPGRFSMDNVR